MLNPARLCLLVLYFSGLALLAGCSERKTMRELCSLHPDVCSDLNEDGWCRYQRAAVIEQRIVLKAKPADDDARYQMLLAWEVYRDCIALAADVRQQEQRFAAANRMRGYLTSLNEIEQLSKATLDSSNPFLLFWHWTREARDDSLQRLLEADKQGELQIGEIQYRLGTYYAKSDIDLAIHKTLRSLELLPKKEEYSGDALTTLATLYYRKDVPEKAYTWMRVAELAEVEGARAGSIAEHFRMGKETLKQLNDNAEDLFDQINDRTFVSPRGQ
ncbi:MAG: DUF2989 domain-containing protein [Gammaproteobacteria bacterium]|nr:DUF2989 domain-containing protein [Gammaproteobacteria bacterium]